MKVGIQLKEKKGITLIAFVITIIVLLILAGVTISTLTGENGILTQAESAKEKTEKSERREQVEMAVINSYSVNGNIDKEVLQKNLRQLEGLETIEVNSFPVYLFDKYELEIFSDGNISEIQYCKLDFDNYRKWYNSISWPVNLIKNNGSYAEYYVCENIVLIPYKVKPSTKYHVKYSKYNCEEIELRCSQSAELQETPLQGKVSKFVHESDDFTATTLETTNWLYFGFYITRSKAQNYEFGNVIIEEVES